MLTIATLLQHQELRLWQEVPGKLLSITDVDWLQFVLQQQQLRQQVPGNFLHITDVDQLQLVLQQQQQPLQQKVPGKFLPITDRYILINFQFCNKNNFIKKFQISSYLRKYW